MLRLLRRVAMWSLALAAVILVVPRALFHFAMVGPSTVERIAAARQTVEVARGYGATADIPAMAEAERRLAAAEALQRQGRNHDARHAAEEAHALASQAQQAALVRRDSMRIKAKQVVDQLDRRVDELEDLYAERTPGLPKERVSELLSRMKDARATAAELVLAWEQQDYGTVIAGEGKALKVLEQMKKDLQSARG